MKENSMLIRKEKIPVVLITGKAEKAKTERIAKVKPAPKAKTAPKEKAKPAPKAKAISKDTDVLKHKLIASHDKRQKALERLITLVAKKKEILKGIAQKIRKLK